MSLSSARLGSLSSKEESPTPKREEKPPDPFDSPAGSLVQRCVIIQRDERGYGLTVSGDNPVFVQSVKDHGAAFRAGVQQGDRIVKVNGTLVINSNHIEVVKLIKSGSYVALTLLGRPPPPQQNKESLSTTPPVKPIPSPTNKSPGVPTPDRADITGPQPVDAQKQEEVIQLKLDTLKAMHDKAIAEYQHIRKEKDYGKNPEKLKGLLEDKLKTVKTLENRLQSLIPSDSYIISATPRDGDSLEPIHEPGDLEQPTSRHPSWLPAGPRHAKTGSVPASFYASPDSTRVNLPRSQSDAYSKYRLKSVDSTSALHSGSRPVRSESEKSSEAKIRRKYLLKKSKSLPSTVLDGTNISHSPQLTPSTSPTPLHPQNRHDSDSLDASESRDSRRDSGVGTMSEEPTGPGGYRKVNAQQVDVISIEDDEFSDEEEDSEDHGPFMALCLLEKKQAHMAVFLHYLISNSDPAPLFFYMVAEVYSTSQASNKDLRKWAYEIMATFLAINAPLKVDVDDAILSTIEDIIQNKNDKEELLRSIFHSARITAQNVTDELLADFRRQKSLGLGNIYGVHKLQENATKRQELTIINQYLLPHLDRILVAEQSTERDEAIAAALVTFLKQVGGIKNTAGGVQIDRVPSFVAKDKRSIKFGVMNKKISLSVRNHQLTAQHFSQITHCTHCHNIIGGLGYPGYTCSSCDMNYHKSCINSIEECSGKKKKRMSMLSDIVLRKPSNVTTPTAKDVPKITDDKLDAIQSSGNQLFDMKPLSEEKDTDLNWLKEQGHSVGNLVKIYEDTSKSPEGEQTPATKKKGTEIGRSESMKGRGDQRHEKSSGTRRTKSDVDVDETLKSSGSLLNNSGSSSTSSLSTSNSSEAVNDLKQLIEDDSDFDVETELPPLKQIFPEDTVKKLKPKEKKRQEVINELFYTERSHVRNMKVLDRVFFRPLTSEPHVIHQGLVNQLFPNLEQLINLHCSLNNAMKSRRKENPVVGEVGDILLQRFEGEAGSEFREGCAIFCRNQSYALEQLRIKQRRDEKFSRLLSEAESNPLCRRLQLKDLIPTAFQRLTKYPLLIENLMKYTQTNSEDYSRLERALKRSKSILDYVNQAVRECENHQRLVEINKKIDRKPFESSNNPVVAEFKNLDLTKRKLVHDGMLTWRLKNKPIDLHVVLLEDILVLLQKQDDRLVLKCQNTTVVAGKDDTKYTHSPIIRLTNLLTRNVATDKKAFFLVSNPNLKPQIYELVASSGEDRKRWFKHITEAADAYKTRERGQGQNGKAGSGQASQSDSEQITVIRPQISGRDRHREGSGENSEGASSSPTPFSGSELVESDDSGVERAGVSDIPESDTSQLIQPEDVTVTDPLIALAEPVLTPQAAASPPTEDEPQTPTPGVSAAPPSLSPSVPVPMDKLRLMAGRMNSILSNLLTVVGNKEEEQDRLRQELKSAQQQLALVKELQRNSFSERGEDGRPSSMISVDSSVSDPLEQTQAQLEESQASVDALHRLLMGGGGGNIRAEDILMAESTFTQSTDLDSSDWANLSELDGIEPNKPQVTDVDEETYYEDKSGSSSEEGPAKFFPAEETLSAAENQDESSDQESSSTTPVQCASTEALDTQGGEATPADTPPHDEAESKPHDNNESANTEGSSVDEELIAEDPNV